MVPSKSPSRHSIERWTIHLVWSLLAVVHGGILAQNLFRQLTTGWSWTGVGTALVLLATFAFFALKAFDVAFLRFRCRRTALIAFVLCSAIAHGDVVTDVGASPAMQAITWIVVVGGSVAAVGALHRWSRRLLCLLTGLSDCARAMVLPDLRLAGMLAIQPWCAAVLLERSLVSSRGPPM